MVTNKFWVAACNILLKSHHHFCKTTMTSLLVPPESVRGMTQLDRNAFTISVQVKDSCFTVYLDPALIKTIDDFTEEDRSVLENKYEYFGKSELKLQYDNWKSEELLTAILPADIEIPVSYSKVGHILHLNLRDSHLPYKHIIGQIYLDTVPNVKTVVNKINVIKTEFRNFKMEILAGENNTVTTVKEHGVTYQFDFAKVYWNPRLSTEHQTLVSRLMTGDVLYDVFAGVGPFAIPAAKKNIMTLANDLNPESYKWLNKNVALNKVTKSVQCFNMDGRDFLKNIVTADILDRRKRNASGTEHIVMNLPALAVEFLDVLSKCFSHEEVIKVCSKPPVMHVYTFVKTNNKNDDPCILAKALIEEKLGCVLFSGSYVDIHNVRNVAPKKEMIRVSFVLDEYILRSEEPAMKRIKVEEKSTNLEDLNVLTGKLQHQTERIYNGEKEQVQEK